MHRGGQDGRPSAHWRSRGFGATARHAGVKRPGSRRCGLRIQRELAAGRRVLLLCQQTETLDITPQWVDLLDRHGIKCGAALRPGQREAWIARQEAAGTEVIITHPRRVQTGPTSRLSGCDVAGDGIQCLHHPPDQPGVRTASVRRPTSPSISGRMPTRCRNTPCA